MTLKEFELSINLLIQTWLTPSLGTASYAENRVKFDEALKVALIEKLRLTNNNAIPLANTNLINNQNNKTNSTCPTTTPSICTNNTNNTDDTNNQNINNIIQNNTIIQDKEKYDRASLFEDYKILLDGYPTQKKINKPCINCGPPANKVLMYSEGFYVCLVCGEVEKCIIENGKLMLLYFL